MNRRRRGRATEKVNSICVRQIGRFLSNWLALDLCRSIGFFSFSSPITQHPHLVGWYYPSHIDIRGHISCRVPTATTWGEESGRAIQIQNSSDHSFCSAMSQCPASASEWVSDMDGWMSVVGGCKSSIVDHFARLVTNEIQFIKTRPCRTISFIFVDLIASVIGGRRNPSHSAMMCIGMQISWQRFPG